MANLGIKDKDGFYHCPPELVEQRKKIDEIMGPYTDKRVLDCLYPWDKWENIKPERQYEIIITVWNIHKGHYWFDANTNLMGTDYRWGYIIDAIEEELEQLEQHETILLEDLPIRVDAFCKRNKDRMEIFYKKVDKYEDFEWNFRKREKEEIKEAYLKNPSKCMQCKAVLPFVLEQVGAFIDCPSCYKGTFYFVKMP